MKNILLILFFLPFFVFGQNDKEADKLAAYLNLQSKDTLFSMAIKEITRAAIFIDTDSKKYSEDIELSLNYAIEILDFYQVKYGKDAKSHWWKGLAIFYFDDYSDAIIEFSSAIIFEPNGFNNYSMRADCKKRLSDFYGALGDYKKSISLAPKDYEDLHKLYAEKGECLIEIALLEDVNQDLLNEALLSFEKAISLKEEYGYYHYKKGAILGMKGDNKSACLSLSRAGELGYTKAYETIQRNCVSRKD